MICFLEFGENIKFPWTLSSIKQERQGRFVERTSKHASMEGMNAEYVPVNCGQPKWEKLQVVDEKWPPTYLRWPPT